MNSKTARVVNEYAKTNGFSSRSAKRAYQSLSPRHRFALKKAMAKAKSVGQGIGVSE